MRRTIVAPTMNVVRSQDRRFNVGMSVCRGAGTILMAGVLAGCFGHMKPTSSYFQNVEAPVLLGPVDRIGGGPALATKKVGGYEGEAVAVLAQSESGGYRTTTDIENNAGMARGAARALEGVDNGDIRVGTLRAWSYGYISLMKSTVYVGGSVVKVGGAP